MAMTGMDIQEVRGLAQQLDHAANEIQTLAQQLTAKLQGTTWIGADRERFTGDWESQHRIGLANVVEALKAAAQTANNNASEQEQASSV